MRVRERRDGALLGSRCGKCRAMAVGTQAIPARHAGVASGGARAERVGGAGEKRREVGGAVYWEQ